jgi:hypothetical protein
MIKKVALYNNYPIPNISTLGLSMNEQTSGIHGHVHH